MHRLRVILAGACALIAGILLFAFAHVSGAAAQPRSCSETTFASGGVVYRVVFAKNGAVQQYLLAQSSHNTEKDHDVLKAVEARYGPEASNAPPLQILSFKPGSGGMMVPDKAVDSCGRITHFH
ncbi:MAG TPA: hypothetical protein VJP85_06820 [Candidatus Baltobacteraceae bacterium]|nr:hypothetical protein [Candidatus Baltobacteraceae bacterium]